MKRILIAVSLFAAGLFFVPATAQAQCYGCGQQSTVRVFNYNTGQWMIVPYGSRVSVNPPGFSTPGYRYQPNYGDWRGYAPGSYRNPGIYSNGNHGYLGPQGGWQGRGVPQAMPGRMPMMMPRGGGARFNFYRTR